MKTILLLSLFLSLPSLASVIGVSTHPFARKARVVSAEMTGYMSQRQEMGMGLRYTHEMDRTRIVDLAASGGQSSRGLMIGGGMDFRIVSEELYRPRVSVKPFFQHQNYNGDKFTSVGFAPALRKGFSVEGIEFFPYFATPVGMKIDGADGFVYQASVSLGTSLPIPGEEKMVVSVEANKNMGASADYITALVSWMWN